jgi:hypothetical protein
MIRGTFHACLSAPLFSYETPSLRVFTSVTVLQMVRTTLRTVENITGFIISDQRKPRCLQY